jgi:hypothetical protein
MKRASLVIVTVLACCPMLSFAQGKPIEPTERINSLDGQWTLDPTKGIDSGCGNTVDQTIRISVSPQGVDFESRRLAGLMKFDGSVTTMTGLGNFNGAVSASLDGGWLALTTRRIRAAGASAGSTNVQHDVYIVRGDELTIWRTFNVEWPDRTQRQDICGNRQAVVYQRQRQP